MIDGPVLINSSNLSYAWARAFALSMAKGGEEIASLAICLRLSGNGPHEDLKLRRILDTYLVSGPKQPRQTCETVSKTIFPFTMVRTGQSRDELYRRYRSILPRLRRTRANRDGTYFERMIAFRPNNTPQGDPGVNQLEKIICDLQSSRSRRSGLQLAIFDPTRDHKNNPYMGFPCLQQVAFAKTARGLVVNAFYPMQYLYERAYGNYLGLTKLGQFVAAQASLHLHRVICNAGVAKREISKREAQPLHDEVQAYMRTLGGFEECDTHCLS